ncbi:MAG: hypothetical protein FWD78_02980 [Treponema sp.]|nr:hypothetical protein [Treponema sp.]
MEKKFLSALMADLGSSDWADTKIKYDHVSWRVFKDRRHQILWRALMEIDIPNFEGRLDILLKEQQDAGKEINLEECEDKAKPNNWFMRELKNAGVLKLAGGEKFVQEVLDIYSVSFQVDNFAKILFKSVHPNKL